MLQLREAFTEQPDESSDGFLVKLRRQLSGAPDAVPQLAAELLFVHFLVAHTSAVGSSRKREVVEAVLGFRDGLPAIPQALAPALDGGLVSPGTAFHSQRWKQFAYLIDFALRVAEQNDAERRRTLAEPEALLELTEALPERGAYTQRFALEHLLFPDVYVPLVSRKHRGLVLDAWPELAGPPAPQSARLSRVATALGGGQDSYVDLYAAPYARKWQGRPKAWALAGRWAQALAQHVDLAALAAQEAGHAPALQAAREDLLAGGSAWMQALGEGTSAPLLEPAVAASLRAWADRDPAALASVLRDLWASADEKAVLDGTAAAAPPDLLPTSATRLTAGSFLLGALPATLHPLWRASLADSAYRTWEAYRPASAAPPSEVYDYWAKFLDQVREDAAQDGLAVPDRVTAQALVRALLEGEAPAGWATSQVAALRSWRGGKPAEPVAGPPAGPAGPAAGERPKPPGQPGPERSLADLAAQLLLDEPFLDDAVELLRDKKQAVFYGPPGTGKTFVARELAAWLAGDRGRVQLVQFHPSYAYEDFVEGLRPRPEGQGFALTDGPLKQMARAAAADPAHTYVLVIDELNRGNVARVFGELYFLLEYRGEDATLLYSNEPFSLPENLLLLATMNSADRSIALLDSALRRRFYFVAFTPDEEPVRGLLRRYLAIHAPDLLWVADLVDQANTLLGDPSAAIGPSHFLRPGLDERQIQRAWEHSVMPALEDRFFGQPARLAQFSLDGLRTALARNSDGDDDEPAAPA
ncbi:AAA family ATPase [Motilibacter aurantiacus]|uniref:AAA family ATPase n=1 Tax=Motilibacter aurantiacus TaxID=2714955 RepID=UPI00140E7FF2|nr:AAA family ATPase [Motilibacter aurantiacus]NHC46739.1 AAA domain-containing protein [Motilibacter aurantiacus]